MHPDGVRILVIDDEKQIRRMLKTALSSYGYEVEEAATGNEGLSRAAIFHPDLIILDLGLPDLEGIEVIDKLREWTGTPIIILSVREHEEDKIKALDAGADDYITKPFSMGELLARIRVTLRHKDKEEDAPVLIFGGLTLDIARRDLSVKGKEIRLTPIEYEILKYLALQAGRIVTHRQLLLAARGPNYPKGTHYLRVYIAQLRHKIEEDPNNPFYIITEPGVGYRFAVAD
jgi:two-component system, OmpR family, KDP operon response regulator KdpE